MCVRACVRACVHACAVADLTLVALHMKTLVHGYDTNTLSLSLKREGGGGCDSYIVVEEERRW